MSLDEGKTLLAASARYYMMGDKRRAVLSMVAALLNVYAAVASRASRDGEGASLLQGIYEMYERVWELYHRGFDDESFWRAFREVEGLLSVLGG